MSKINEGTLGEEELVAMLGLYPRAVARLYTCGALRLESLVRGAEAGHVANRLEGWLEVKLEVERRLRRLEPRLRRAVCLCYLAGRRQREAAEALGVSQPRLSAMLRRARRRML